jgi:hypothetical protein
MLFLPLVPFAGGIRVGGKVFLERLGSVGPHRPELVAIERPAGEADAPMGEDDRAAVSGQRKRGNHEHQRRGQDKRERRDKDIHQPFCRASQRLPYGRRKHRRACQERSICRHVEQGRSSAGRRERIGYRAIRPDSEKCLLRRGDVRGIARNRHLPNRPSP